MKIGKPVKTAGTEVLAAVLLWGMLAGAVIWFLYPVFFAFPAEDDYYYAVLLLRRLRAGAALPGAVLSSVAETYMTWQGNYFSFLVIYLLAAADGLHPAWVRLFLAVSILIFFGGLLALLRELLRLLGGGRTGGLLPLAALCLIVTGLNRASPGEAFYWQNAVCVYTFPFALSLWGLAFLLAYRRTGRRAALAGSAAAGVCAAGGSLMIAGFASGACLFVLLASRYSAWRKQRRASHRSAPPFPGAGAAKPGPAEEKSAGARRLWLPFVFAFTGSAINAAAPGNFLRQREISSQGVEPLRALGDTAQAILPRMSWALRKGYLIPILFLLLAVLLRRRERGTDERPQGGFSPLLWWAGGFAVLFVTAFPVILGYGSAEITPWRFCTVFDLLFALYFVVGAVCTALPALEKSLRGRRGAAVCLALAVLSLGLEYGYAGTGEMAIRTTLYEARRGILAEYRESEQRILDAMEALPAHRDVVILGSRYECFTLKHTQLSEDPDYWTNRAMAEYFGCRSVTLLPENGDGGDGSEAEDRKERGE
ncbi:DUF6056 family protein [Lachnoclostridium sp. Marseille-P6806]|uniref:DUF6056 family protein n=1 Tax=Lachnoclostridium sp. Marseille-P6806 TaxID=2364793 RepID=UPI00102FF94C|nr:DUF6056 family protein [Lachnoclostridium sp. Marseille-P6806]